MDESGVVCKLCDVADVDVSEGSGDECIDPVSFNGCKDSEKKEKDKMRVALRSTIRTTFFRKD